MVEESSRLTPWRFSSSETEDKDDDVMLKMIRKDTSGRRWGLKPCSLVLKEDVAQAYLLLVMNIKTMMVILYLR